MPEFSVPSNATIDRLNQIIVGWYRSKAHESPVANAEVTKRTGVPETEVSRQNAFLQDIGILQKEGNQFKLTPLGTEYARLLDFGQLEEAKVSLRTIFRQWNSFQQIFDYVDLKGPLSKDDVLARIGLAAEKKPTGGTRTGISAVVDLLLFCGMLVQQDSSLILNKALFKEEVPTGPAITAREGMEVMGPQRRGTGSSLGVQGEPSLKLELTLNLDGSLDPAKLKELLKAIREVFFESEQ